MAAATAGQDCLLLRIAGSGAGPVSRGCDELAWGVIREVFFSWRGRLSDVDKGLGAAACSSRDWGGR